MKHCLVPDALGRELSVVDPSHFHALPAGPARGLGLFCRLDLEPGDCWWPYTLSDPRFVSWVLSWDDYLTLPDGERRAIEVLGYVDGWRRAIVVCAEPFCRVNHAPEDAANSRTDGDGNSVLVSRVPAWTEITIPYDYDTVLSLLWKFPDLQRQLPDVDRTDPDFLFAPAADFPSVRDFLARL